MSKRMTESRNSSDDAPSCRVVSKQGGVTVTIVDEEIVFKKGSRVRINEERAMRLVKLLTNVPVPEVLLASYGPESGSIGMELIAGSPLNDVWDQLDDPTKKRLCRKTWCLISDLRKIAKPQEFNDRFACGADGSTSLDVLLKDLDEASRKPIESDHALRARITDRYYECNGRKYTRQELFAMLPHSKTSVFTHGDIAPRNILVNEKKHIVGIIDWEDAGWYPEYWEYANIMKPSVDHDWQLWMESTAPEKWDIGGITAARRVLF